MSAELDAVDRRSFLKGVAAAYIVSKVPRDIYGLSTNDAALIFPKTPKIGQKFQVRVHGYRTMNWPSDVTWRSGQPPDSSGGVDLFQFVYGNDSNWRGSVVQDVR